MSIQLLSPLQFESEAWPGEAGAEMGSRPFFTPSATPEVFFSSLDSPDPIQADPAQVDDTAIAEGSSPLEDSDSLQQTLSKNCTELCQKRKPKSREEKAACAREFYQIHKDELAARARIHHQNHRDESRARNQAYRQTHRAKIAAYIRKYRQIHKDEIAEHNRIYRQAKRVEIAARKQQYRRTHQADACCKI